ncbi:MAG: alanine--tRNA ligase [Chloroflexota bacterium]
MKANDLRNKYLDFLRSQNHTIIQNAPLIPENDPSVLFTTAGMHPLAPYLLGMAHPAGRKLANVQKCLRTNDILEVGDDTHLTFFEMLGSWSLGDYWKEEALTLNFTLLTEVFGHAPDRLSVTCFAGDEDAPRDDEAAQIWQDLGIPASRITFLSKEENWWGPAGLTGPCGPDSEVFYDLDPTNSEGGDPVSQPERFVEICNNVFMAFEKDGNGCYHHLPQPNVDVGIGFERNLMLLNGCQSVFETELFVPIIEEIQRLAQQDNAFAVRVIADHLRSALFVMAEGIIPGKTDQPYVVRRLIRRAIRYGNEIGIKGSFLAKLAEVVIPTVSDAYPALEEKQGQLCTALDEEEQRFQRTLVRGERKLADLIRESRHHGQPVLAGEAAFDLYQTFGYPIELVEEAAQSAGIAVNKAGFQQAFEDHQALSRQGAADRFKGGLAERSLETTKLHTATHLLQAALRQVLGTHVEQRGSNITNQRLRFDFSHGERLSQTELDEVERLVNQQIESDVPVTWSEMSLTEAQEMDALGLFADRYGDTVKVYCIGAFSTEVCGGPHVESTGPLENFRIKKQESAGSGIRRIKAVLVDS